MSHGSHDTHHDPHAEEHSEQPKPEPILKERTPETLDAAVEALNAANEFLMNARINFDELFGELRLENCPNRELQRYLRGFEEIITLLEPLIQQIQKNFDEVPEEMRGLFDAIDFVQEARKKESLEKVKGTVKERKQKVKREYDQRESESTREHLERYFYFQDFEKSGLPLTMLLDVVSKVSPLEVKYATESVIARYETESLSPVTKKKIENKDSEVGSVWEEIHKHERDVQIEIDQIRAERDRNTIQRRFNSDEKYHSPQLKDLRKSFQIMENLIIDPQRVAELNRTNKFSDAEAVRDEASAKLYEMYNKEFEAFQKKEEQRIDQEVDRLEKKKFEKRRHEEEGIHHDVQKDVPEQILKEVMRSSIDTKDVSLELAQRILKEKGGIEKIDMDLVFSLPETVLDAIVDTLSYVDIAKFMATSARHPDNLPPIYWSESFEKKLKSLNDRFDELGRGGLFEIVESSPEISSEKKIILEERKKDFVPLHKAYHRASVMGDHKGEKTSSGKYNDFFVPELQRLFEMKRIRQALCGQVDESSETIFVVDGQKTISEKDGHLLVEGNPYPDSEHNTGSAPLSFHRLYGYTAAERLNDKELPNVDFKKAVDWLTKLYGYQVVGKSSHLDVPIQYRMAQAESLRQKATQFDEKIQTMSEDLKTEVETLKNDFESDIHGFEQTRMLYNRSDLKDSNGKDLRDVVVAKTKEIGQKFDATLIKGENEFASRPNISMAERQLHVAKYRQFVRKIEKLQDHSYRPVERVVGMTREDYIKGKEFFDDRSEDLRKEILQFEERKEELENELREKRQKFLLLEEAIHDNAITDHQWRFWERKIVGKTVEYTEVENVDSLTGQRSVWQGFVVVERLMKRKEFELLKEERDAIKKRVIPKEKKTHSGTGKEKTPLEIELENLEIDHQKRKQEIQKDIDEMLRLFPLISVFGDDPNP